MLEYKFLSIVGEITLSIFPYQDETDVKIVVHNQPDWNFLRYQDGQWGIYKSLTFAESIFPIIGKETAPGAYAIDLTYMKTPQKQDVEFKVLQEIVMEMKKNDIYKYVKKSIRKRAKAADAKVGSMQRQICRLLSEIETHRRFLNLSTEGL